MKRITLIILAFINSFILTSQTSVNFDYDVEASICNGSTGKILIKASDTGLANFSLPWYIEIENKENIIYRDYILEYPEATIEGLPSGLYSVIIWMDDLSGCYETLEIELPNNNQLDISADIYYPCSSQTYDGRIDMNIGEGVFKVDWYVKLPPTFPIPALLIQSNSNVINGSGDEDLSGIPAGNYAVVVTDQHGCSRTAYYEVINNGITVTVPAAIAVCQPGAGVIIPEVSGGTGIYTYAWSNGETEDGLYGLDEGTYSVTVTDEGGCSAEASGNVIIGQSDINISTSIVNDCGNGAGSVSLQIDGGAEPYDYSWSNGAATHSITGLAAGIYTVTVTDQAGCSAVQVAEIVIDSPIEFTESFEMVRPATCTSEDGYIKTFRSGNIQGGVPPYSVLWSTGSTDRDIGPVTAGIYTITVTDANGCIGVKEQALYAENGIEIGYEDIKNTCKDVATGRIHIVFSDNVDVVCNELGLSLFNVDELYLEPLGKGFFNFNIKGSDSDCFLYKTYEIKEKENIEIIDIVQSYYPCKGDNTAIAEVILNNLGQINIQWKNLDSGEIVSTSKKPTKLAPGLYEVSVTDVECMHTSTRTIEIEDNGFPGIESVEGDVTCVLNVPGGSWESGKVNITAVEGGTAPYSYYWNGQNGAGPDIYPFGSGTYTVTVTDANNCSMVKSYRVNESNQLLKADITVENPNGCEARITELDVHVKIKSGNPPYVIYFEGKTYEADENEVVLKMNPRLRSDGYWDIDERYIKIKDACAFEYETLFSTKCASLCKSCIQIGLKNAGAGGCIKTPYNRLNLLDLESAYSYFTVKSNCNTGHQVEVVDDFNEYYIFNGKGSKTSQHYLVSAGYYLFKIYDKTTGCFIPQLMYTVMCEKSIIKWFSDNAGGGGGNNGNGNENENESDDLVCTDKDFEFVGYLPENACIEKLICFKTGEIKYRTVEKKVCSVKCDGDNEYRLYEYCPGNLCDYKYKGKNKKNKGTCPDCIQPCIIMRPNFDPPTCLDTVKDLILDTIENKYVAFWNDTDSLGNKLIKGYAFSNTPALKDDGGSYALFKSDLDISFVRVDDRENYYVAGKNNGNFLNKYNRDGLLLWTIPIAENKVSNVIQENNQLILVSADEHQSSTFRRCYDEEGNLLYASSLPVNATFMDFNKTAKNRYIGYQELTRTVSVYDSNSVYSAVIPDNIKVKTIKFRNEEEIVVIAEFKNTIIINGNVYNTNGITKPILIIYDKLCRIKHTIVPDRAADVTIDIGYVNESEIILYGQIRNAPDDLDSTVLEDCNYIWVLSLDSTECTTFASELTFDQELCELSWDNVPEGYTTTLEYISNDSIWISALPNDGNDGFITPYRISRDATYSLTHQKAGCPDMASNELVATCGPVTCPVVSLMYDDEEDNDRCYIYQIQHGDNQKFKFIIRTWLVDTTALQFTDTVTFTIGDTTDTFSYCDLPEQYRCYNHGDMRIICTSCDTSCQLYYDSWSCIPRTDTKDALLQTGKNIYYYPNPFAGGIYLHFLSVADDNMTITVYNSQGGEALQNQIQMKTGENVHYLKAFEKLSPGIYTVHLKGKDRIYTSKVVKIQ